MNITGRGPELGVGHVCARETFEQVVQAKAKRVLAAMKSLIRAFFTGS